MSQTPPLPNLNDDGLPEKYPFKAELEITPRQVKSMLGADEDFLFIDLRTEQEVDHVSIELAMHIPMHQLMDRIDELEDYKDKTIVTFCHHGGRSMRATLALREMGLDGVLSMAGGIDLWAVDIEPGQLRY